MSEVKKDKNLDVCGCCEEAFSLKRTGNRAGLPEISYRLGTHWQFLKDMMDRIHSLRLTELPEAKQRPLGKLSTRASNDPAIAFFDAWAMVLDVLTFYQERIANEGFLRTASERRSVLELARTIGYELSPGVAASTFLAFTLETSAGMSDTVSISRGTQVKSLPAPGKLPQTFETRYDFEARLQWNSLKPRLTRPQTVGLYGTPGETAQLYLIDTSDFLPPDAESIPLNEVFWLGDWVQQAAAPATAKAAPIQSLALTGLNLGLEAGQLLLLVGEKWDGTRMALPLEIKRIQEDGEKNITRVYFQPFPEPAPAFQLPTFQLSVVASFQIAFNGAQIQTQVFGQNWLERDFNAFLLMNNWNSTTLLNYVNQPRTVSAVSAQKGVFIFREKAGFFGQNAPHYESLPAKENLAGDPYPHDWDANGWEIWKDPLIKNPANPGQTFYYTEADAYVEGSFPAVVANSWAVFKNAAGKDAVFQLDRVSEVSRTGFGISAKTTALILKTVGGAALSESDKDPDFKMRTTTAYLSSQALPLAELPIEDPLRAGDTRIMLNELVLGLQKNQALILSGERTDLQGIIQHEVLRIFDVLHSGGFTALSLQAGLTHEYLRESVSLNANVVEATHGETVSEVLGSGDGSRELQSFKIRKLPLTYLPSPSVRGIESSLTVRVDGVEWQEAPFLYGLDETEQKYVVRLEDDGTTIITFGDGKTGSRLPTGVENVTALYRTGLGPDGEVQEGSLTLLQKRPPGVKEVVNPLPASGSAMPEDRDSARENAPLTVLTLDRVVSLQDFEDFARSFAGVGKAKARVLWDGRRELVHITIASATGKEVEPSSGLIENLVDAINALRDPFQPLRVDSFQLRYFNLQAGIRMDARYRQEDVFNAIEAALLSAFSFPNRQFEQPVTAAEIVAIIQKIEGVIATDMDKLYRVDDPVGPQQETPPPILPAAQARFEAGEFFPAQLLLLNPAGVSLKRMEELP